VFHIFDINDEFISFVIKVNGVKLEVARVCIVLLMSCMYLFRIVFIKDLICLCFMRCIFYHEFGMILVFCSQLFVYIYCLI